MMSRFDEMNLILASHKISEVSFVRLKGRYPRLHGMNAVKGIHGYGPEIVAARIRTDKGASGWGEAVCIYSPGTVDFPRPDITGLSVTDIFDSRKGIKTSKHGVYDIALHDLAGKILGIPVASMISENAVSYAPVYDGAIYMNDLLPEGKPRGSEAVLSDCDYDYSLGYRSFKIKIGRGFKWMSPEEGFKRDVEIVKAIHERHPDAAFLVDANDAYTPESMIRFLEAIYPINLYWIEEPFREAEEADRTLKDYLNLYMPRAMIADGESYPDIPQLLDLATKKLIDVIQPDVVSFGFTPWRALMLQIEKTGALASPHAWGDVIKTNYCAHLAAAFPRHIPLVEAVLGETEGMAPSEYVLENGILTIPQKSGFGMEIDWVEMI
jgi:L-alanine-DL-glutamate epimerase-like enolase superfamily enzyme